MSNLVMSEKLSEQENETLNRYLKNLSGVPLLSQVSALFEYCRVVAKKDNELAQRINLKVIRNAINFISEKCDLSADVSRSIMQLKRKSLFFSAREDFDSFMQYMEIDRPIEQRFYIHRRPVLLQVVKELQDLADEKLDMLFIEMPPRVGKSTIGLWFMTWFGAKNLQLTNLLAGHTVKLVKSFYTETDDLTTSPKYKFLEIFPELEGKIKTYAKDLMINFGDTGRYKTFSYVSPDTPMSGVVEVTGILYVDDLIEGLEEAMNADRVEKKWMQLNTDIMQRRANSKIRVLNIGTPWTKGDPAERLFDLYSNDPNYRIKRIQIPATDENFNSNFNYNEKYHIGFTSQFYKKMSETMDTVSYQTVYMLKRLDRDGLLFKKEDFKRFRKSLLQREPDNKYAISDVAWGGGDNYSMPIIYEYDGEFYLADAVFSKGNKDETRPIVVAKTKQHKIRELYFEKNNGGDEYGIIIKDKLIENNYYAKVTLVKRKNTKDVKRTSILTYSPEIQKIYILEDEEQSEDYRKFIQNLLEYNQNGKSKHDDAPDSLALFFEFCVFGKKKELKVLPRSSRF